MLVTGGAGFIGSHLVDGLLDLGAEVVVLDSFDDFYSNKEENIKHNIGKRGFSLVRGSILDEATLGSAIKNTDIVVHMAGQPGIKYCNEFPEKAHLINVVGTFNVLQAMRKVGTRRLLFASSSSIFGPQLRERIDEGHPTNPSSPYGATKLAAEKYCSTFGSVYNLEVTCLRYFSVYGPRGRPDQIIAKTYDRITNQKEPIIYGDGSQIRDFTYISDIVEATLLALQRDESIDRIFNIGYGEAIGILDIITRMVRTLDGDGRVKLSHEPAYSGDFQSTFVDNTLARKILGWEPKIRVDDGIQKYISWKNTLENRNS